MGVASKERTIVFVCCVVDNLENWWQQRGEILGFGVRGKCLRGMFRGGPKRVSGRDARCSFGWEGKGRVHGLDWRLVGMRAELERRFAASVSLLELCQLYMYNSPGSPHEVESSQLPRRRSTFQSIDQSHHNTLTIELSRNRRKNWCLNKAGRQKR